MNAGGNGERSLYMRKATKRHAERTRRFLRALASATFLMGRASSSFILARHTATSALVTGAWIWRCRVSSSENLWMFRSHGDAVA